MRSKYVLEARMLVTNAIITELQKPNRQTYQDIAIQCGVSLVTVFNVARTNKLLVKDVKAAATSARGVTV